METSTKVLNICWLADRRLIWRSIWSLMNLHLTTASTLTRTTSRSTMNVSTHLLDAPLKVQTLHALHMVKQDLAKLSQWWESTTDQFLAYICWQQTTLLICSVINQNTRIMSSKPPFMRSIAASCMTCWTIERCFIAGRTTSKRLTLLGSLNVMSIVLKALCK